MTKINISGQISAGFYSAPPESRKSVIHAPPLSELLNLSYFSFFTNSTVYFSRLIDFKCFQKDVVKKGINKKFINNPKLILTVYPK